MAEQNLDDLKERMCDECRVVLEAFPRGIPYLRFEQRYKVKISMYGMLNQIIVFLQTCA